MQKNLPRLTKNSWLKSLKKTTELIDALKEVKQLKLTVETLQKGSPKGNARPPKETNSEGYY